MVISMIAVGGIVGLLLFNTSMQQASFAATDLQQRADTLLAQQQSLQMELDKLRDPQTIALKAQQLGMVLPTSPAVLDLRTGKVLGQPAPATGADRLRLRPPPPAEARGARPQAARDGRPRHRRRPVRRIHSVTPATPHPRTARRAGRQGTTTGSSR